MASAWLYPGVREGVLVEEARSWRYECRDGALVEHRPGQPERVLARPGQVSRVAVVTGDDLPRSALLAPRMGPQHFDQGLIVRADAEVVLAVPLRLLATDSLRDATQLRSASGATRFAQAFGLALEPADADDVAAFRTTARTAGPVAARAQTVGRAHLAAIAAGVVAALTYTVLVARDGAFGQTHPIPLLTLAVTLVALTTDTVVRRRQFDRFSRAPAPDERRTVAGPGPFVLQVGPGDVVLHGSAWEHWIPGPSRGGAQRCEAFDDAFVFTRADAPALVAPASMVDAQDLSDACRAAGIDLVRRRGSGLDRGTIHRAESELSGDVLAGRFTGASLGNGFLLTPLATTFGALVLSGAALIDPERRPGPLEVVLGLVGLAVLATQVVLWWTRRRWIASTRPGASRD